MKAKEVEAKALESFCGFICTLFLHSAATYIDQCDTELKFKAEGNVV